MDPIVLLFFATALLALTGAFTAALMFSVSGMPPKPRYRRSHDPVTTRRGSGSHPKRPDPRHLIEASDAKRSAPELAGPIRKDTAMSITADSTLPALFPDDWARTRPTDPLTSHEAADSTDPHASHSAVLNLLREQGALAQFQAEAHLNGQFSPSRIRSAFSELEEQGRVERLDDTVLTPRGRRAQL